MLITSGQYYPNPDVDGDAHLLLEILDDETEFTLEVIVSEYNNEPAFYIPVVHPLNDSTCFMFNLDSFEALKKQIELRFEEIKEHGTNEVY